LRFSAKTSNAIIDWGDGSGEQALDTLAPTHTYSKAGRYVVKCKGVTGIARQITTPCTGDYLSILKYVELNNEVNILASYALWSCVGLHKIVAYGILTCGTNIFSYCSTLKEIVGTFNTVNDATLSFFYCLSLSETEDILKSKTSIGGNNFVSCISLQNVTIPNTITEINNNAFNGCASLSEIHCQATTPPTLGTGVFNGLPSNYIIYVPVGYAETYKAASGWSTYADHILEEGQTPNRAMLAKFGSAGLGEEETDNEEMR
jgi:hypothetical protein